MSDDGGKEVVRSKNGGYRVPGMPAFPERDNELCILRNKGWSYARIAQKMGFNSPQAVHQAYLRAMQRMPTDGIEEAKRIQLAQLDDMTRICHEILEREHVTVSNGRLIEMDGQPLPDDTPLLATLDRLLKIQERRAKLMGLDAPAKSRVEIITEDAADQLIAQMDAEIKRLGDVVEGEFVEE